MDVGPLVVADTEASKLIEPGKCPLDDQRQVPKPLPCSVR